MSGGQRDFEDPLDRLAAEEDWDRRAKAIENQVARDRLIPSMRPGRTPQPRRERGPRQGVSLIFVALLVVMAVTGIAAWTGVGHPSLVVFVFVLSGWLVSLCLHEFAHALVAHRSGDGSVAAKGYLRLDPRKYGHWVMTLLLPLLILLIGGLPLPGGAVLIEHHRLRNRFREALVSAAGPAVNVVAALGLLTLISAFGPAAIFDVTEPQAAFWAALTFLAYLQIAAAILNLLPVPGLDGWGVIEPYLPESTRHGANKIKPFGVLLLFALLYIPGVRHLFGEATFFFLDLAGAPVNGAYYGLWLFQFWNSW
jgi:Zn-dependent protease